MVGWISTIEFLVACLLRLLLAYRSNGITPERLMVYTQTPKRNENNGHDCTSLFRKAIKGFLLFWHISNSPYCLPFKIARYNEENKADYHHNNKTSNKNGIPAYIHN